jgi:L1 cell adhesion molecule like protein
MSVYELYEIILIGGSTRIPKIKKLLQEFFKNKPINQSINSEETIAYGAAIEAAVRTNVKDDIIEKLILLDVFPNSFGIETAGGITSPLFPRNFTTPTKKNQYFSTYEDNQTSVLIQIFE